MSNPWIISPPDLLAGIEEDTEIECNSNVICKMSPFSDKKANAQRIIKCVNNHDQLVGALKYARRFLHNKDVDIEWIDLILEINDFK